MKVALVTGAYGQLGHFLVPLLSSKGYEVYTEHVASRTADEVYVLHQVRRAVEKGYSYYMSDVVEAAQILERYSPSKVLFCGSVIQDEGESPWHLSRQFIATLVKQFPNAKMPKLGQFVSKWVNKERQYTGRILHELALGIEPRPKNYQALVKVSHARDVAEYVYNLMQGSLAYLPNAYWSTVEDYIDDAEEPGSWLNTVVQEIKEEFYV